MIEYIRNVALIQKDCEGNLLAPLFGLSEYSTIEQFCCKRRTVYECRRGAAKDASSRSISSKSRRWRVAACIRRVADGRRSLVGRRPVNLILVRSFVRYVCTRITMVAAKKKSETFETSFSQTSGSDNGVKKTRPVECTALKFLNARRGFND